jgi:hypothetical protein
MEQFKSHLSFNKSSHIHVNRNKSDKGLEEIIGSP